MFRNLLVWLSITNMIRMFSKKSFPCFCLVIEADVHGAEFLIIMIIIFISNLSIYLMSVFVCSSNQKLLKDTTLVWVRSTFWSSRQFLSRLVLNFHFPTCGYLVTGEWLIPVCVMKIICRVDYGKIPCKLAHACFSIAGPSVTNSKLTNMNVV